MQAEDLPAQCRPSAARDLTHVGRDDRIKSSIYTTLETVLAPYEDPVVARSAAHCEIDPAALLGPWGGLLLSLAFASVLLWAVFVASRLGGLTGDALGSSVEVGEVATLVAAASLIHLRVI